MCLKKTLFIIIWFNEKLNLVETVYHARTIMETAKGKLVKEKFEEVELFKYVISIESQYINEIYSCKTLFIL